MPFTLSLKASHLIATLLRVIPLFFTASVPLPAGVWLVVVYPHVTMAIPYSPLFLMQLCKNDPCSLSACLFSLFLPPSLMHPSAIIIPIKSSFLHLILNLKNNMTFAFTLTIGSISIPSVGFPPSFFLAHFRWSLAQQQWHF